jgi:hypothetical protein
VGTGSLSSLCHCPHALGFSSHPCLGFASFACCLVLVMVWLCKPSGLFKHRFFCIREGSMLRLWTRNIFFSVLACWVFFFFPPFGVEWDLRWRRRSPHKFTPRNQPNKIHSENSKHFLTFILKSRSFVNYTFYASAATAGLATSRLLPPLQDPPPILMVDLLPAIPFTWSTWYWKSTVDDEENRMSLLV